MVKHGIKDGLKQFVLLDGGFDMQPQQFIDAKKQLLQDRTKGRVLSRLA